MSSFEETSGRSSSGQGGVGDDPLAASRPRPPPNRRRDKPQLSCKLCRRRKLRCDRQNPCSTCSKRGLGQSCTYATNQTSSPTSTASVQERLKQLENLVVSFMSQSEGAASLSPPGKLSPSQQVTSPALPDAGSLKSIGTETKYQDQTHWNSILDAISDLRVDFGEPDSPEQPEVVSELPPSPTSPLLYGCKQCSKEEILAAVPPRDLADRLVSECFEMLELSSCAFNKSDFFKQYALFWANPQSTPIMWLGLLFSLCSVAVNLRELDPDQLRYGPHGTQLDYGSLGTLYREKTAQCLFLGQYTRSGPFVVETLLHHFVSEYTRQRDISNEAWLILSTTVQIAMRMGYHKDPDHFKSISPYEGELRRRLWSMIYHIDIVISGQLGVPRLINDSFVDTAEPRNLLETDLNPNMTELPPSRPECELTPMMMVLSRLRAGRMSTVVTNVVTSSQPPTYAQVLQVDRQIEDMYLKIPEFCREIPQPVPIAESGQLLLTRLSIQMSHQRAQIILHWRYLSLAKHDDRYLYSAKTTISAALKILDLHHVIYEGLKTGNRLYSMKWRISPLFGHDLLIALSILCFYVQQSSDKVGTGTYELKNVKEALRCARIVWNSRSSMPKELQRGFAAIEAALPDIFSNKDCTEAPNSNTSPPVVTPANSSDSNVLPNGQGIFVICINLFQASFRLPTMMLTMPLLADPLAFGGSAMPFFDPMFEGLPMFQGTSMFPSPMNDMGAFIDSVLAGSVDPWAEISINPPYPG